VPSGGGEPPFVAGQQAEAADRALSADLVGVEQIQQEPAPLCRCGRERRVERIGGVAHGALPDPDVAGGDGYTASAVASTAPPPPGMSTQRPSTKPIVWPRSSLRECTSTGRRCSWNATSAMRAERLAERTDAKVAVARTSVAPAVAKEEIVAQSATRRG